MSGTEEQVRLGIAVCGRLTERGYLPAAARVDAVRVTALADPDPARLEGAIDAAGRARCVLPRPYPDVAAMLRAGGLDAVVVAAPAEHHVPVARAIADAGLPALVEKPPAPGVAGARVLAALTPAPWIGFNRRFLQGAAVRTQVPAEGWLELDLALMFQRDAWAPHAARDDALLDAASHLVDLAAFLTGSRAIAVRDAEVSERRATFEVEVGRGRVRIACATDRRYGERVQVRDRGGRTVADWRLDGPRARLGRVRGRPDPLAGSLGAQLTALAAAVRGADPRPLASAADGIAALQTLASARRSAELGGAEVLVAHDTDPQGVTA
jgi:myo-inositol 2-dehydrogenase / D-chiro-inositol 1-dehydrogenase